MTTDAKSVAKPRILGARRVDDGQAFPSITRYFWTVFSDEVCVTFADWNVALRVCNRESARLAPYGFDPDTEAPRTAEDYLPSRRSEVQSIRGRRLHSVDNIDSRTG